jgi:translation initiation factor IF-2
MEGKATRLSKIAREFNVGINTIVEFLHKKGFDVDPNPNTKVTDQIYEILVSEYSTDFSLKRESERLSLRTLREKRESVSINDIDQQKADGSDAEEEVLIKDTRGTVKIDKTEEHIEIRVVGKIDLEKKSARDADAVREEKVAKEPAAQPVDREEALVDTETPARETVQPEVDLKVVGKIDLDSMNQRTRPPRKTKKEKEEQKKEKGKRKTEAEPATAAEVIEEHADEQISTEPEDANFIKSEVEKLAGLTVVGKIDLPEISPSRDADAAAKKKKRKRIRKDTERVDIQRRGFKEQDSIQTEHKKPGKKKKRYAKVEVNEEDVQRQIKDTLARLTSRGKSKASRYRREKRDAASQRLMEEVKKQELEKNIIKVTEFVTVNELASLMNIQPTEVIAKCMDLGLFVSINQRLDAETLSLVADEYGYKVNFITADLHEATEDYEEDAENLKPRPPIVTVMGHVDHGKTKLLDHIRKTNVIAGEAGGITQHIGAYNVSLDGGRMITFLDTPGHEAFTAMRARGAQATDVAIIVVAADDGVMPQTIEAINHAQAAGVPIVFAINKIDKNTANPDKIKEELAKMNFMVEEWGGKYQSQDISAKNGINIEELLEKVLLEAEMLDLKANPDRPATGTVIESSLDKGRGYVATVLVQNGTIFNGDVVLAGTYYGHVKAMYNERGKKIDMAGPSTPVLILGLNGAPQAGDHFKVMTSDKEAKEIATRREQLQREQEVRTQKHITLDEIGRRIAIGNFQELNVIIKGDVDGSIEALTDSLVKLSTEEIQVRVIHKAVGQIKDSDVMLAAASNAIIIGFQVRPSMGARKLAEKEEIDIRIYSVIYDAIEEIRAAMEGMLSPEIKEEITATVEVKEIYKITKVGTVAGCVVKDGKIQRNSKIRVIRDGIVVYTGQLGSLKRFKEDVKEVTSGLECGLNIENFNDVKAGDIIEGYLDVEVKKKL